MTPYEELTAQIKGCNDWDALNTVVEHIQAAFTAEQLTQKEAETLTEAVRQHSYTVPEKPGGPPPKMSDLFAAGPWHIINSKVLGEKIIIARDDAEVPTTEKYVIYREHELRKIAGKPPEILRKIHEIKSEFDAEITNL